MKVQIKFLVVFILLAGYIPRILSAQVTPDAMMNTTLDTWTTVDMVRSIAREDRYHLYPKLIKAHLDLYATTYWFTEQHPKDTLSCHYIDEIADVFTALTTAQKDTLTGQSISDDMQAPLIAWNPTVEVPLQQKSIGGLFSCMIMDHTNALWNKFTNSTKSS